MGLFNILVKFSAHTSGVKAAFSELNEEGIKFSHQMKHNLMHVGLSFLGIHASARGVKFLLSEIINLGKDTEKTKKEFADLGMPISEEALSKLHETANELERMKMAAAMSLAPAVGAISEALSAAAYSAGRIVYYMTFGKIGQSTSEANKQLMLAMSASMGNNPVEQAEFMEKRKEKLRHLVADIKEIEDRTHEIGMSNSEKIVDLKKRELEIRKEIGDLGRVENYEAKKASVGLLEKIALLQHSGDKRANRINEIIHPRDALAQVGGFAQYGGAYVPPETVRIVAAVERTAENTEKFLSTDFGVKTRSFPMHGGGFSTEDFLSNPGLGMEF